VQPSLRFLSSCLSLSLLETLTLIEKKLEIPQKALFSVCVVPSDVFILSGGKGGQKLLTMYPSLYMIMMVGGCKMVEIKEIA
jgi:hypothetical protein